MAKRGVGYKVDGRWAVFTKNGRTVASFPINTTAHPWSESGAFDHDAFKARYCGGGDDVRMTLGASPLMGGERTLDVPGALRAAWKEKWEGLENRGGGYDGEPTTEEHYDWQVTHSICSPDNYRFIWLYREGSEAKPITVTEANYASFGALLRSAGIKTLGDHTADGGYGCRGWKMHFHVEWLPPDPGDIPEPPPPPEPDPLPEPVPPPELVHPWLSQVTVDDLWEQRPRWLLRAYMSGGDQMAALLAWVQYLDQTPDAPAFTVLRGRYG